MIDWSNVGKIIDTMFCKNSTFTYYTVKKKKKNVKTDDKRNVLRCVSSERRVFEGTLTNPQMVTIDDSCDATGHLM